MKAGTTVWPQVQLETLIRMWTLDGVSVADICKATGRSRGAVINRARRIPQLNRKPNPSRRAGPDSGPRKPPVSEDRRPMQAGHPTTWGAISTRPWPDDRRFMTASRVCGRDAA